MQNKSMGFLVQKLFRVQKLCKISRRLQQSIKPRKGPFWAQGSFKILYCTYSPEKLQSNWSGKETLLSPSEIREEEKLNGRRRILIFNGEDENMDAR